MALHGRKVRYLSSSKPVCFTVYWTPEGFGAPGKMSYTSVICDGILEHITQPAELTRAARTLETQIGYPPGSLDSLLEMTLKNPVESNFWQIKVMQVGGKGAEDFQEEFEE